MTGKEWSFVFTKWLRDAEGEKTFFLMHIFLSLFQSLRWRRKKTNTTKKLKCTWVYDVLILIFAGTGHWCSSYFNISINTETKFCMRSDITHSLQSNSIFSFAEHPWIFRPSNHSFVLLYVYLFQKERIYSTTYHNLSCSSQVYHGTLFKRKNL